MADRYKTGNAEFGSLQRSKILKGLIVLIAISSIGRLGYLQIIKGSAFLSVSEAQAIKQNIIDPFRGNMYDRNGELIVQDRKSVV